MITPLYDRVVLEAIEKDNKTEAGVLLPATLDDGIQRGIVFAVGRGSYQNGILIPLIVEPGHIVLYPRHAAIEIKLKGKELILIREGDILAIVKE